MNPDQDADFDDYAAAAIPRLRRVGFLLCGDWHRSEDAVQNALVKLYGAWPRIADRQAVDAYARTTLLRCLVDESRRPWRRERSRDQLPDQPADQVDDALVMTVRAALKQVSPRQRAALVLRFYEQCDVAETARILRCSPGTVKSQTARGLVQLRELLGDSVFADLEPKGP